MKERKENRFPSADGRRKRKQIKTGPNPMKKTVLETGPVPERRKTVLQGLEWAGTEVPAPGTNGYGGPAPGMSGCGAYGSGPSGFGPGNSGGFGSQGPGSQGRWNGPDMSTAGPQRPQKRSAGEIILLILACLFLVPVLVPLGLGAVIIAFVFLVCVLVFFACIVITNRYTYSACFLCLYCDYRDCCAGSGRRAGCFRHCQSGGISHFGGLYPGRRYGMCRNLGCC